MSSIDYIHGYEDGIKSVMHKLTEVEKEMYVYANRKNFKGLSRRDVVYACLDTLNKHLKEFEEYGD